ncbi:hypothetical protein ACFQVA_11960 [Actinomadura keratinilytica]
MTVRSARPPAPPAPSPSPPAASPTSSPTPTASTSPRPPPRRNRPPPRPGHRQAHPGLRRTAHPVRLQHRPRRNKSDTQAYSFYADSPGTPDKPGDANGDGFPDLYSLDASGGLRLHPGAGSGGTVGTAAALPALGLKDALVTRRGDWTADSFEDLVARHADGTLWLYPADGTGRVADLTRQQVRQFTRPGDEGHIDPATFRQLVSSATSASPTRPPARTSSR